MRRTFAPLALSTTALVVGALIMSAPFVVTLLAATQDRSPTGDGFQSSWEHSGTATDWEAVDDAIGAPDDDTTYIIQQDLNASGAFTFTAFSISSSSITDLTVRMRCKNSAGDANAVAALLRINNTTHAAGASQSVSGTYTEYVFTFATNPATSTTWTEDEIEGVGTTGLDEFGAFPVNNGGPGEEVRCTQIYARVNYVAAAGATARGFMGFF